MQAAGAAPDKLAEKQALSEVYTYRALQSLLVPAL